MSVPIDTDDQALEARRVLLVEGVPNDLPSLASLLPIALDVAASFAVAKAALKTNPPDLLITPLRLEAFNGLHLVLHGTMSRPAMAAIVLSDASDASLQQEAEALGATFIVLPVAPEHLLAAVLRASFSKTEAGPIRPPYERRVTVRRRDVMAVASDRRAKDRRRTIPVRDSGSPLFGVRG